MTQPTDNNDSLKFAQKFARQLCALDIDAHHVIFESSCHTVQQAAAAINGTADDLVKNLCLVGPQHELVVAIVKGPDRVSTKRVAKACGFSSVQMASPDLILERTGFPVGGTPSFGFDAKFLIDPAVMDQAVVYTGGGSDRALVRVTSAELQRANGGMVVRIRK